MTPVDLHMEWCPNGGDCDDPKCGFWININDMLSTEREACAQIADTDAARWEKQLRETRVHPPIAANSAIEARSIAAAIRARNEETS